MLIVMRYFGNITEGNMISQSVDTESFWKHCKRKNNGLETNRKVLKCKHSTLWVNTAFTWVKLAKQ